jgi:hypothetical protein
MAGRTPRYDANIGVLDAVAIHHRESPSYLKDVINRPANGRFAMLEIMKTKPPSILQRRATVHDYE